MNAVVPMRGPRGNQLIIRIPTNGTRLNPHIARSSRRFHDLYGRRIAVEREFGRLKTLYGLAPLRIRGIERIRLHADLTMLARLSLALYRVEGAIATAA